VPHRDPAADRNGNGDRCTDGDGDEGAAANVDTFAARTNADAIPDMDTAATTANRCRRTDTDV
jgi:hypothetical protein